MYSLVDFGNMLRDEVRVKAYRDALQEMVPGKRVLEIGGGTGFFACLASSLGAAHVTSIEQNPLITKGALLAKANGLKNIEFVLGSSQHFEGPEAFDVIIHDLRGNTPFFERSMSTLRDASRLLSPTGRFLPRRDRVFAALVQDSQVYQEMQGIWAKNLAGLDLRTLSAGTHRRMRYQPGEDAKTWEPLLIADVSYLEPKTEKAESLSRFKPGWSGVSHGVVVWFETELTERVGYTTNPWAPEQERGTTYGVAFFPWPRPIEIDSSREYQLRVGLDAKGNGVTQLSLGMGSGFMLLGSFVEKHAPSDVVQLPTDYSFAPHPLLKAYRIALQGLERGQKVSRVVRRIQDDCLEVKSKEAAYKILVKCVEWTQVQARRGRERVTRLRFGRHRIRLVTNSPLLLEPVLEKLSPSWKPTRSKGLESLSLRLQEVYTPQGLAFSVTLGDKSIPFDSLEEALEQIEFLALQQGLLACPEYIQLDVAYVVEKNRAHLLLGEPNGQGSCLLDLDHRVIPYATSGRPLTHQRRISVASVRFATKISPALMASLLIQRCRNVSALADPLAYFTDLVKSAC